MRGYGSLFERLSGEAGRRSGMPLEAAAKASVAAHLSNMLSTRAGSVQTLPDYGLPDMNDMQMSLHDSLQQVRYALEKSIERYEPRLREVRVVSVQNTQDPLKLGFEIHGLLMLNGTTYPIALRAQFSSRGRVEFK